jgi:hypothetical protein
VVHARRVLSNVPVADRPRAAAQLWAVTRGWLVVVDVFQPNYTHVNDARQLLGLKKLPPPHMGRERVWVSDLIGSANRRGGIGRLPAVNEGIGEDYFYWTRVLLPAMTGKETPYDATIRKAHPVFADARAYGVHRILIFKKGSPYVCCDDDLQTDRDDKAS